MAIWVFPDDGIHFTQENGQIRCIAHVVNLVVQKFLSELFEADDPMLHDYYEEWNKHLPFHYDTESDEENQRFEFEGLRASIGEPVGPQDSEGSEAEDGEGSEDDALEALLDGEDVEDEGDLADVSGSAIKKVRLLPLVFPPHGPCTDSLRTYTTPRLL